jgi:hypothetical protein
MPHKRMAVKLLVPRRTFSVTFSTWQKCKPDGKKVITVPFLTLAYDRQHGIGRWMLDYVTRPQTWLRHAVFDFVQRQIWIQSPVSEGWYSATWQLVTTLSAYRGVRDNCQGIFLNIQKCVLFTDDANAIDKALAQYPEYNWMYIKRKRHASWHGRWL